MKRKKISILFLLLAVSVLLSIPACKDKKGNLNINYQYDYFPLDSAHYVDYDVDSITYNFNGNYQRDTAHYQLREIVVDTFYDNTGLLNYTLELYRRPDSISGWGFWKKWFVRRDSITPRLLLTEDDLKFVKLVFPPQTSTPNWNGNEYLPLTVPYNVFNTWSYFYESVNTPITVNGFTFNNVAVVSEVNDSSLIQKRLRREFYAEGVGMIYQEWEYLTKQNINADWNTGPEDGFRIRMYVRGHNP